MKGTLEERLEGFPRLPLAKYPTPLEPLPRLSQQIDREVYVKRDDTLGPGLGGNKTRKLEYLLAEARARNARKVVTFGGLQSNHARITAAAARRYGMEPHLFYFEPRPRCMLGNLLACRNLGARMYFVPLGGGGGMSLETTIRLVHWLARLRVGRHYFIPVGGHSFLGGMGYVRGALELHSQAVSMGIDQAHLLVAAGSGGTLAGLLAGLRLIDSPIQPLGIDVGKLWKGFPASIAHLANGICRELGSSTRFKPEEVPLIEARYVGTRYGAPSPEGVQAMRRLARLEGLLLDPVYTAKAFAALLDLVANGRLAGDAPLIFLHTGGLPGLFAFDEAQYEG
jgi:D-cysteine desulfhydrase family pyridoxal phosphate-dependent enzyme